MKPFIKYKVAHVDDEGIKFNIFEGVGEERNVLAGQLTLPTSLASIFIGTLLTAFDKPPASEHLLVLVDCDVWDDYNKREQPTPDPFTLCQWRCPACLKHVQTYQRENESTLAAINRMTREHIAACSTYLSPP